MKYILKYISFPFVIIILILCFIIMIFDFKNTMSPREY